jgi:putative SOS response-associated peptidase YedK
MAAWTHATIFDNIASDWRQRRFGKVCGRYITAEAAALERAFRLDRISWSFQVSYNVAPTQRVPVVRATSCGTEGLTMRWGLVPFFAKGEPPKYSTINAAVEKLETAASWRGPWGRQERCLIPAAGFYEWHLNHDGEKHPFFIHLADQDVFAFAGIWDHSYKPDGTSIASCAIVTLPANGLMRFVHNTGANPHRMPAILDPSHIEVWLTGTSDQAKAVLKQYPEDLMVAHQVSTRVNRPKNDGEKLIEAVPQVA